jgi:hypothetical protein
MSKIVGKTLFFTTSDSADIAKSILYYQQGAGPVDPATAQQFPIDTPTPSVEVDIDLGQFLTVEGNYSFGLVEVDKNGNQGDLVTPAEWTNIPLDLTAPDPATGFGIKDSST